METIPQSVTAEPRHWRLKTIVLLTAVLVVLAIIGAAGFLLLQSRTVDHYFARGNDRFDRALARLDRSLDELAQVRVGKDPAELSGAARRIGKRIPAARSDLDAAAKAFSRMRKTAFTPWETKTASLLFDGARHAREGTKDLESGLNRLSSMAKMLVKVKEAADRYNEGFTKTNEAVTAGNDDKFAEAKQNAAEADSLFSASQKLLIEADKISDDPSLGSIIPLLSKGRQWATGAEKMADAGGAKQIAVYNELVKENNRLSEEVAGIGRAPVLADPRGWFNGKLDQLNDRMADHFNQADRLREKALQLWRKNT